MKKVLILLFLSFFVSLLSAQERISFSDFVRDFDWTLTKSEFRDRYKDRLIVVTDGTPDFFAMEGFLRLDNICFYEYTTQVLVRFYEQENEIVLVLNFTGLEESKYAGLKKLLIQKLGEPTYLLWNGETLNKEDMKIFDIGLDFERIWVTDKYVITWYPVEDNGMMYMMLMVQKRKPDFRQSYWGESLDEIKKKEGKPDENEDDAIYTFTTTLAGIGSCLAVYRFTDNELTSGKYILLGINSDNCIQNYERLLDLLIMKYGEPGSHNKKSTVSELEHDAFSDGYWVTAGKMRFDAMWSTSTSTVGIFLYGEQYVPMLIIEYMSNLHQNEMDQDILKDL